MLTPPVLTHGTPLGPFKLHVAFAGTEVDHFQYILFILVLSNQFIFSCSVKRYDFKVEEKQIIV